MANRRRSNQVKAWHSWRPSWLTTMSVLVAVLAGASWLLLYTNNPLNVEVGSIFPSRASGTFSLVFSDDFSGTSLASTWTQYDGHAGPCCPINQWRVTNLTEAGGMLTENITNTGGIWSGGGVSQGKSLNQTYGEWDVRMRMDRGKGTAFGILLWPQTGWPPEIDFAEEKPSQGVTRSGSTATLHYGSTNKQLHHKVAVDVTGWHTYAVRWIPGKITYLLDGAAFASDSGTFVPKVPMHLAFQTEVGPKGSDLTYPDSTTPNPTRLQVDWVKVYSYH